MANALLNIYTYYISASYIGEAMEGQNFLIYHTECGNDDYLVNVGGTNIITSASLAEGIAIELDQSIQTLYLLPLAEECPLGCVYDYSLDLSEYVAPSPTPSPSSTPPATVTPSPSVGVSPTPSASQVIPWGGPFGYHSINRNGEQLRVVWSANDYSTYERNIFAYNLASYLTNGNPPVSSTSETSPNTATLPMDFYVYNNARTSVRADVERLSAPASPVVYYFSNATQTTVVVDDVSVLNFTAGSDNYYYIDKDDI